MDPQTICPKDLIAIKESPATHREVLHFIPEDLHLEDTHMADQDKFRSSGEQTGSTFEEPWPELFDELFAHSGKCYTQLGSEVEALRLCHIVGLERILGCIEKIQTDEEQKQGDSCLFTVRYYAFHMPAVRCPDDGDVFSRPSPHHSGYDFKRD